MEELGIKIGDLHYVGSHTEPYLFQGVTYQTLAACFVGKFPEDAKPEPADDVADFKFFKPDSLPTDKFAFDAIKKDFQDATRFFKQHKI
jgi:NADH pyrophosphatase NudC (nudix superfamily)